MSIKSANNDPKKIKKIPLTKLMPGMVVAGYVCDWGGDPSRWGRRLVQNQKDIDKIHGFGIEEVYIDTSAGLDVEKAPSLPEVKEQISQKIVKIGQQSDASKKKIATKISMQEELAHARKIKDQAMGVVTGVLADTRLGKQVDVSPVKAIVEQIAESMFRNTGAILSLSLIKQKDEYTFTHSVNVGVFLISFARAIGMSEEETIQAGIGGMLHDIGKMKIPLEILNKPGKLTEEEFALMKRHALFSGEILRETPGVSQIAVDVAQQHHERFNGSGYPFNLGGDQLSQAGQMAAIVDVYDAITSNRCYHRGMNSSDALKKMYEWSKHHFDLALFQKFILCVGIHPVGSMVRLKNHKVGVVIENHPDAILFPVVRLILDARKKCKIEPQTVDLSTLRDKPEYKIVGQESPLKWGVDPKKHFPNPKMYR